MKHVNTDTNSAQQARSEEVRVKLEADMQKQVEAIEAAAKPAEDIDVDDSTLAANAIERMRASGVTVTSCESLLYEWLEGCEATTREQVLSVLLETGNPTGSKGGASRATILHPDTGRAGWR